jgi:hypothetical protein
MKVIEFKQGKNPYDTMDIGSNREPKNGDNYICLHDIISEMDVWRWVSVNSYTTDMVLDPNSKFKCGKIYSIQRITKEGNAVLFNEHRDCFFMNREFKKYFKRQY